MQKVITAEFSKASISAPVRTHCRLDGGQAFTREVRVVLIRAVASAGVTGWYGIVADSKDRVGASVTNAAADFILAGCRLLAVPLLPNEVAWFQRDSIGRIDRMVYGSRGVEFSQLDRDDVHPSTVEALILTLREAGIDTEEEDVRNALNWALL
ncbi:hypothetical protein LA345_40135 (plasmid) [Burkholderia vietnamiensis]|uniref:Uncharacterized protein n=1 Tax=Burkholderia vietnamiensis (strain G4 / LMG 22486) TaxID=269482 RepID=A4JU82_BURVG|nr:hypothetical protein Bcep1808_6948 [Burkholderia vietnamiensis G4]MCB4350003.1 hypothetical protein [Burkholderia vietnamiensis]